MRIFNIGITGTQPLLMHRDDIEWADRMEDWKNDKDNKKSSKAGDDRTPAFRWLGCLYRNDSGAIILPTENIMRSIMEGATMVLVPGGRMGKTFKSQSQSGIVPRSIGWPLHVGGKPIRADKLDLLMSERSFRIHCETAKAAGFELFMKRAKIGQSKHVRVRPLFRNWSASGELAVIDDQITDDSLKDILIMAGRYKGLGDWRPGGKTPGSYGMFEVEVERVE